MIYLIMVVFSAVAMPSCAAMDSLFHFASTKPSVSPPFTNKKSPDSTLFAERDSKPSVLHSTYREQDLSTLALVNQPSHTAILDSTIHSLSKYSRHHTFNHQGKRVIGTNKERTQSSRQKFSEPALMIHPFLELHNNSNNLAQTELEVVDPIPNDSRHSVQVLGRRFISNSNRTEKPFTSILVDDTILESSSQINKDPRSSIFMQEQYKLVKNIPDTNRGQKLNKHNCDKVKRSVSAHKSDEEVTGPSAQSSSLQETAEEGASASLENPSQSFTSSNLRHGKAANSTRRGKRRRKRGRRRQQQSKDLALWIDEQQVKLFSGYMMEIFVIHDGKVLPYILDPNFEKHLPVIPYEVQGVNFTWQSGRKRYYYTFDRLYSHNPDILEAPAVSLPPKGRIPRKPKVFTVNLYCFANASGTASFDIGLLIQTRRGKPLPGTPLRLKLRKECTQSSVDPECDEKCENGGVCDVGRKCQCPEGYMGPYCNTALCYPQCMNGGTCTTPGRCTCPPGYQGRHCEGGICQDKCENGGKCIQKDTCACPRGYYGNRCEFSKCVIPCINGGRCRNVNKCRCPRGFAGDHCEVVTGHSIGTASVVRCSRKCRHGSCSGTNCICNEGFTGKWCRRRGAPRKRVWL